MNINTKFPQKRDLLELEERVPIVTDKCLIDLVNGLSTASDLVQFRKGQTVLNRLIGNWSGANRERDLVFQETVVVNQKTLLDLVKELWERSTVSELALIVTQRSLLETRQTFRQFLETSNRREADIEKKIQELVEAVDAKISSLETRIDNIERKLMASDDFERIITSWTAGKSYSGMPLAVQIVFLAREVFSSSVGRFDVSNPDSNFRRLLVDKILSYCGSGLPAWFSTADFFDKAWNTVSAEDLPLIADLLDFRYLPVSFLRTAPFLFVIGSTFELANLEEDVRPLRPGKCAVEIFANKLGEISRTVDFSHFVNSIVDETSRFARSIHMVLKG